METEVSTTDAETDKRMETEGSTTDAETDKRMETEGSTTGVEADAVRLPGSQVLSNYRGVVECQSYKISPIY
jgi:hypothetical protein